MKKIETFTKPQTRFLSNFYPHKKDGTKYPHTVTVIYNDIEFDCVENAYQAAKFIEKEKQKEFAKLSPYQTKEFFENNAPEKNNWNDIKLDIMRDLVFQKFNNSKELKQMLLDTGNAILEEGNDWDDTFWGICNDVGQNNLGKILMDVRKNLSFC